MDFLNKRINENKPKKFTSSNFSFWINYLEYWLDGQFMTINAVLDEHKRFF